MARRRQLLTLQKQLDFEAVIPTNVVKFAEGSGHITGLGNFVGKNAIVIILADKKGGN